MLKKMRKTSETVFVQFILGLIAFSFIFVGISDGFMGQSNTAVQVENKKITIQEVNDEVQRQIAQMQSAIGNQIKFDYVQALKMGLLDQIINNMVFRVLLDLEAEDQGIVVSDDKIYEILQSTPEFQDEKGNFSPEKLAYIIDMNNVSEKVFINEIANDVARQILLNAVRSNIDNTNVSETLYKSKNEKRIIDIVEFDVEKQNIDTKPLEKELKDIYDINTQNFVQPEYRKISYITISSDMAKKFRNIKNNDGEKIYKTMFEMGEDIIDEIINSNMNTKEVTDIVEDFGVKKTILPDMDKDGKTRDGKEFKKFKQKYRDVAFFALDEKGISDVMDDGENLIIIMVESVYPSKPKSFETVKSEINKIWKKNKQVALANDKMNKTFVLADKGQDLDLALENIDKKANLKKNITTSRINNNYSSGLLSKIFNTEKTKVITSKDDNKYYVVKIKDIIIPAITNKVDFEKFKNQEKENFANLAMDDYMKALYKKYDVEVNNDVINRLFQQ